MLEKFIDKDWFKVWTRSHYPQTIKRSGVVLSFCSPTLIDSAEQIELGPYSAGITFGVFKDNYCKHNLILFSLFPFTILSSTQLITHIQNLCHDYLNNSTVKMYDGYAPDILVLPAEEGSNNSLLTQIAIVNNDVPIKRFYFAKYGRTLDNMLDRAMPIIENGRVWVTSKPGDRNELRNIDQKFLDIVAGYPSIESKAIVWSLVQAILYLQASNIFADEDADVDNTTRPNHAFY